MAHVRLAVILGVLALACVASGAEYYISPFGSDSNSGTSPHSAFLTLSQALSSSSSGDTINAANGFYTGSGNVGLTISDRTLTGESVSGTVFQASGSTVFMTGGSTFFNNLSVKGSAASSTAFDLNSNSYTTIDTVDFTSLAIGVALSSSSKNLTISNCSVDQTVQLGLQFSSSGTSVTWESIIIKKSTFSPQTYPIYISCSNAYDLTEFTVTDSVFTSKTYISWDYGADLTLFESCTFSNITTSSSGGAVSIEGRSVFSFDNCVFTNNVAESYGGAIYFKDDTTTEMSGLNVTNSRFVGNIADGGGAIYSYGTVLTVSESLFALNNATVYDGGAIYASPYYNSDASYTVDSCIFVGNSAASDGGALLLSSTQLPSSISNSVFAFNNGYSTGGAVAIPSQSGTYSISTTSFIGNSAQTGGALSLGSSVSVSASSVSVLGNSANYGGGFSLGDDATLTLSAASISSNVAKENGGGISMGTGTLSLEFISFTKNAAANGGGFYTSDTAAANLFGARITGNDATTSGGGFYCGGGGVNLGFVTISGNDAPQGSAYTCNGNCGTYATSVHVASNNDVYGCGSDSASIPSEEVEALLSEHLASVPAMTWDEAARLLANVR